MSVGHTCFEVEHTINVSVRQAEERFACVSEESMFLFTRRETCTPGALCNIFGSPFDAQGVVTHGVMPVEKQNYKYSYRDREKRGNLAQERSLVHSSPKQL